MRCAALRVLRCSRCTPLQKTSDNYGGTIYVYYNLNVLAKGEVYHNYGN